MLDINERRARELAAQKKYRESLKLPENAAKLAARRIKRRGYNSKFRTSNRESYLASQKRYRQSHREERNTRRRENYAYERDHVLARCKKYFEANRDLKKHYSLRTKYGISLEQYRAMCAEQGNKCKICRKECPLAVDHCHATGKVRGLLCRACNSAIGKLGDTSDGIRSALKYLIDWEEAHGPLTVAS